MSTLLHPGAAAALGSALLFGVATPLAKRLLEVVDPWLLAGLLYFGSGLGLAAYRLATRAPAVRLARDQLGWLAGAVAAGGIVAPVLLLTGLVRMSAANASLLLNAEVVFTALLAWVVFRENVDRRIAAGMLAIVAGALVLSWPADRGATGGSLAPSWSWPGLAVLAACLAWAIDNNLTRKVALADATWLAAVKGGVAGACNLALALAIGASLPSWPAVAGAMALGLASYGVSLALFIVALRQLGAARTGAYFSTAPFFGAAVAVAIGEEASPALLLAGALMALGVWLHLSERHEHGHTHEALEHEHGHTHDDHHQHAHETPVEPGTAHSHWHRHDGLRHAHLHFPDEHHRHMH